MKGGIYTREKCLSCGVVMQDNHRNAVSCPICGKHQASRLIVKFGSVYKNFHSYEEAHRALTGMRYNTDLGTFDDRDYRRENPLSFSNLVEKWLSIKEKEVKPSSYGNLKRYMTLAINAWGNANIKSIDYAEFEDFFASVELSAKTRHNIRSCFHAFWTWLVRRKVLTLAQFPEFPEIKFNLGYRKIIDKATQQAIIEEVSRISYHLNPKIWLGIKWLATYIAIRPGELVLVREKDIDTKLGLFVLLKTKEGREKFVPMLDEDKELINALPKGLPNLPFFRHGPGVSGCKAGEAFGHKYFYKWWKRACENLGICDVDLYGGTRHSSATALKQFLSPEQIKAGTMHSTNKAFERYFQTNTSDALEVFKLTTPVATVLQPGSGESKTDNLLKLKIKNGGGAGS